MARRRKRSRKIVSWLIILILLVIAGVVVKLVWDNYFGDNKGQDGDEEIVAVEEEDKEPEKTEDEEKKTTEEKEETIQYDGEDPNEGGELTGVVTYAGVVESNLMIRINIDQFLSDGTCKLKLINDGVTKYRDTASIAESATTSTCEGFNVPLSEITDGNYEIVVEVSADGKTGVIRGEVEI
ncbi:hypothetical protein IKG29_03445 [Candidatus Saccharibacteria bacterium]|nr:hypothetical protein [Candidatus Saccharibacteria bacterium]